MSAGKTSLRASSFTSHRSILYSFFSLVLPLLRSQSILVPLKEREERRKKKEERRKKKEERREVEVERRTTDSLLGSCLTQRTPS
jgi:hypothetical protein